MNSKKNNLNKSIWYLLITLIFYSAIFIMNRLTLFTSDDYAYHFVYKGYLPTEKLERVAGIVSILKSQVWHWQLWNGRFVAHSIVQFFLQYKKIYFDIFNSAAFVLLNILMLSFSMKYQKNKPKPVIYLLGFLFLWFYLPEIGKTVLWVSGSGNYLWTCLIYLGYFYFSMNVAVKRTSVVENILIILLGFLAGACNENSSPTMLLMTFIYMLLIYFSDKKWNWALFFSLITGGLGFILMMLSPGSRMRGSANVDPNLLANNFTRVCDFLNHNYLVIYITVIIMSFLVLFFKIKFKKESLFLCITFLIGHFTSAFVMLFSPEIPDRTFFASAIFLGVVLFILLNSLYQNNLKQIIRFFLVIAMLIFSKTYIEVYKDLNITYKEVQNQYQILYESSVNTSVALPIITPPKTLYNAYNGTANLSEDEMQWFNQWMSAYFNKKSIRGYVASPTQ